MVLRTVTRSVLQRGLRAITGAGGGLSIPYYQILVKTDNAGTSTSTQFTLPATGTYDVDWGDGTVEEKTGAATHTYASAGEYVIKVTGGLTRITFNNGGDKLKLLEVQNWGDATWSSFNAAYYGCSNCLFNATDSLVLPTDCTRAFQGCTAFNQSVANWNTAAVTTMFGMLASCPAFNQSVANFDTAAVTNMAFIFNSCPAFNQSVANFNTAAVTNMQFMFNGCSQFNQSVANFNTAAVTDMQSMFFNCTAFNQSVSSFNTAAVTTMSQMFRSCTAFNQSVASFDTAKVTNMFAMFFSCTAFNQSVANFDTAAVTNMQFMFNGCSQFKQSVAAFSLVGLNATTSLEGFATSTNINATSTTTNYDATLIAWAAQLPLDFAQSPNFGTAKYSAGAAATARAELVAAGWTITDGGVDVPTPPSGFSLVVDDDGNYIVDDDGNYLISED